MIQAATVVENLTPMGVIPDSERQARPLTRLYRQHFPTFEAYCRERWGMARNYANKMIAAAEVVTNLGTNVSISATESQARPLTRLEPEVRKKYGELSKLDSCLGMDGKERPRQAANHFADTG